MVINECRCDLAILAFLGFVELLAYWEVSILLVVARVWLELQAWEMRRENTSHTNDDIRFLREAFPYCGACRKETTTRATITDPLLFPLPHFHRVN